MSPNFCKLELDDETLNGKDCHLKLVVNKVAQHKNVFSITADVKDVIVIGGRITVSF